MLIIIPAFLRMCDECEGHGRIVFPDGSLSVEFCSEESAYRELRRLRDERKLTEHELVYLKYCLKESALPRQENETDFLTQFTCRRKNRLMEKIRELSEEAEEDAVGEEKRDSIH